MFTILSILLLGGLVFWGVSAYFNSTVAVAEDGGNIVIGEITQPENINPILLANNETDADISEVLFSSLVKYNSKNEIQYDLMSEYEMSGDKKSYTVKLKENIYWHDGSKLTAEDIVFTFNLIQNPEIKSPLRQDFQGVSARALDEKTILFKISQPFTPFITNLTFGILPKHLWENIAVENFGLATFNIQPVGSGAFEFKELKKNNAGEIKSFKVSRNEDYYGEKPHLDSVTFQFYKDQTAIVDDLTTKKIETISAIPEDRTDEVAENKGLETKQLQTSRYFAVFFNASKNETLKDTEVRNALSYSINRQEIISQVFKDDASVVFNPILEGFLGYSDDLKQRDYSVEKVDELLKKQGWDKRNTDGIRVKGDKTLSFILTVPDSTEEYKVAQALSEQWRKQGIEVVVNPVMVSGIQEIIKERDYEALFFGQILNHDPDPYSFWHSSQKDYPGLNLSSISNSDWDKILEEARQIRSDEERAEKYKAFQELFNKDIPAIFIYRPEYVFTFSKKIKGIDSQFITIPSDRLSDISSWYIKTKRVKK